MKHFNPTSAQIEAAQYLFCAMAFNDMIQPVFSQMEADILATGQYHYDEHYYTGRYAREGFPADRILTNPKDAYMIAGLTEYCNNENACNDAARFYSELRRQAENRGFIKGENAASSADYDVTKAEHAFIIATKPIHGIDLDDLVKLEHRKELLKLTLNLFSGLVKNGIERMQINYYNERMQQRIAA